MKVRAVIFAFIPPKVQLTVERSFAHVRTLISAQMGSPFPKFVGRIFDDGGTRAGLRVVAGERSLAFQRRFAQMDISI